MAETILTDGTPQLVQKEFTYVQRRVTIRVLVARFSDSISDRRGDSSAQEPPISSEYMCFTV